MSEGILDLFSFLQGGFANVLADTYTPVSFPLSMPSLGIRRVNWNYESSNRSSISPYSLSSQIQKFGGQKLSAQVEVTSLKREEAEKWISFLLLLDGENGTFLFQDSNGRYPNGVNSGIPLTNGANQTGNVLVTKGWNPGVPNQLKAGDWISFPDYRLHKVLRDASSDGAGRVVLDLKPKLRSLYPDGTFITTVDAKGLFRLSNSNYTLTEIDEQRIYSVSFSCEEAY